MSDMSDPSDSSDTTGGATKSALSKTDRAPFLSEIT